MNERDDYYFRLGYARGFKEGNAHAMEAYEDAVKFIIKPVVFELKDISPEDLEELCSGSRN